MTTTAPLGTPRFFRTSLFAFVGIALALGLLSGCAVETRAVETPKTALEIHEFHVTSASGDIVPADPGAESAPLLPAAADGNIDRVTRLLNAGAQANVRDKSKRSPLHLAAENSHPQTCRLLVEYGAFVDAVDRYAKTPLHLAAENGHSQTCQALLSLGANVNLFDSNLSSPLCYASQRGHRKTVATLLDHGADIYDRKALDKASEHGHLEVVKVLLDHGMPIADERGNMPLQPAAYTGCVDILRFYIERGANVNGRDGAGATALYYASDRGHAKTAAFLIESGADVNIPNNDGHTPLDIAKRRRHGQTVDVLLAHGAVGGDSIEFPHSEAKPIGRPRPPEAPVSQLDIRDQNGRTAFLLAVDSGNLAVARMLLDAGADPTIADNDGRTPLHAAVRTRDPEMVALVLAAITPGVDLPDDAADSPEPSPEDDADAPPT